MSTKVTTSAATDFKSAFMAKQGFDRSDRVAAPRDVETTKPVHPSGPRRNHRRGPRSTLVVFFAHQTPPTNLRPGDLRKLA